MSERVCTCNIRTKLVGDGCSVCNPQYYIEMLEMQSRDDADEIDRLRADLSAAKTALENQIAHTTNIANLCARQRAWIDGVMAQKVVDAVDIGTACANLRMVDTRHREIDDALHDIEVRSVKTILRPAPFEDK